MKIALHNPVFLFMDQERNFNGYNLEFLRNYADIIYLSEPWNYLKYKKRIKEIDTAFPEKDFIFSPGALNKKADVLLSFNGRPDLKKYSPPKKFHGLKIWHVMDYVFRASSACGNLRNNGVDFVMGYADHGKHCPFFRKFYSQYINRVISVPFGFGPRFNNLRAFNERVNKVIALGAVNPVNDPLCRKGLLEEYVHFYKKEEWTHKFRRILAENQDSLTEIMDSRLPKPPQTKNPGYDAVKELNDYVLFVNDEGLMNFPPARTYEGIACGAVMIASDDAVYRDMGFVGGENYISFSKNNLQDFTKKAKSLIMEPERLREMQKKSLLMAKEFTHKNIARNLYGKVRSLYK